MALEVIELEARVENYEGCQHTARTNADDVPMAIQYISDKSVRS